MSLEADLLRGFAEMMENPDLADDMAKRFEEQVQIGASWLSEPEEWKHEEILMPACAPIIQVLVAMAPLKSVKLSNLIKCMMAKAIIKAYEKGWREALASLVLAPEEQNYDSNDL